MWYNFHYVQIIGLPMVTKQGLGRTPPDQKKKQRSFQETPLLNNGTLKIFYSQGGNYGWN